MKTLDYIETLKALAEINRLRILRLLLEGTRGVNDISAELGMSAYNVSRHLRILKQSGLVECEKLGQQRLHSLAGEFRQHLSSGGMVLDLGCCQFDFRKLPQ